MSCKGTVVAFKTSGCKYMIQYTDGTTAMLNKTALKKILSPEITEQIPIAEPATAAAAAAVMVGDEAVLATKAVAAD